MFNIKKQLLWSKLKVGLVITLALLTLFIAVFFAGSIERILSPKADLKAQIQNVKGLRRGAPVWVSGIEVGSVKSIDLHPVYGTIVTLSIDRNALGFLKKDAEASVLTMGLLGDKYIELSNGTQGAEPIKPEDMIKGATQFELKDVMEASTSSIEKIAGFIGKLENLVTKIEKGEGTIPKFLTDPSIYENLRETTKTLSLVLKDIESGQGTINMLLEDPSLYNKLLATSSSIEELSKKIKESSGTLNKLIEDPELYENLNKASQQLSSILEKIEAGEGIAGDLIADRKFASDLKDTVMEIRELTKDIRENPRKYFKFSLF
ncbi:MAG: MlaD family protein [Thermodesulfovibrionales bacterium]|nr:MlaD family protein [Thermodesulfovibrionales bacterium]